MNQEQCRKNQHLNKQEREIIQRQLEMGTIKSKIATMLNRDLSTIKREVKKGTVKQKKLNPYCSRNPDVPDYIIYDKYYADVGQKKYENARQNCGAKNKFYKCIEFVEYAEEMMLDKKWSPDTVVGYAKANQKFEDIPAAKTMYNWIDAGLYKVKNIDLLLKLRRKPRSKPHERKKILGKSIDERPEIVDDRQEFGHWEGDGIVGKYQKSHLITLVERKTGIGLIFNIYDKKSYRIVDVLSKLKDDYCEIASEIFKTITFDNGSEFSRSDEMEQAIGASIYYAHPYSAFEHGTNENWNGIVRRFIPKGSSFDCLCDDLLNRICNYINTMPRKKFNYRTPLDLFNKEISAILTV